MPQLNAVRASRDLLADRYRLDAPLGEGGMAIVARGFDVQLGVERAIKILLPELARKRSLRERFEAEARIMARLEHPHVVQVFDVGVHGGTVPFIAMECLPGGTLHTWQLANGAMPAAQAAEVVLDLCGAVAHAHAAGVIHRDIKPHNALVTRSGAVKLADFGIARTDEGRTRTGAGMGTLGFVAPEQLASARQATPAADVYSLAVTLWTLVTDGIPEQLAYELDHGALDAVPEPLRAVLLPALAQRVERRTPDVAAFAAALRAAAAALPEAPRRSLVHTPGVSSGDCPSWDTLGTLLSRAEAPRSPRPPPARAADAPPARAPEPRGPYEVRLSDEDLQATLEAREARRRRASEPKPVVEVVDRIGAEPARVDERPWWRSAAGGIGWALGFAATLVVVPLGLIAGLRWADGAFDLRGHRAAAVEAAVVLVDQALLEGPLVVRERERAGDAEARELVERYHAIEDATGPSKVDAARVFVEMAEQQIAAELPENPAAWTPEQHQAFARLVRMRQALEAYQAASVKAGTASGVALR